MVSLQLYSLDWRSMFCNWCFDTVQLYRIAIHCKFHFVTLTSCNDFLNSRDLEHLDLAFYRNMSDNVSLYIQVSEVPARLRFNPDKSIHSHCDLTWQIQTFVSNVLSKCIVMDTIRIQSVQVIACNRRTRYGSSAVPKIFFLIDSISLIISKTGIAWLTNTFWIAELAELHRS